ncbi:hypothetical protein ACFFX0_14455 [Citricoccus parietis]|uniref:Uncharacterized protein n=1 Tax=Citricoccus parietis TaxID=592307 RepID=A0ABV5G067_9MICC
MRGAVEGDGGHQVLLFSGAEAWAATVRRARPEGSKRWGSVVVRCAASASGSVPA